MEHRNERRAMWAPPRVGRPPQGRVWRCLFLDGMLPEARMNETDDVIIGAGHNGLTCAAYLAQAGLGVRVVERRKVVGGAAVTEEFAPGFRNSVAAYTVSLLE